MKNYSDKTTEELLRLAAKNPTLPIVAMVNGEVCNGEEDGYWVGAVVGASIDEIWKDDYTNRVWSRSEVEIDPVDFIDNIEQTEEVTKISDLSAVDAEPEAIKFIGKLPWTKSIVIYIETIENS